MRYSGKKLNPIKVVYLLPLLVVLLVAIPVLAVAYTTDISVYNTGVDLDMVGIMVSANITNMVTEGFISATGRDTDVEYASIPLPYMLTDSMIIFATSLGNHKIVTFNTGVPDIGSFDIITLDGGYVTVADNPLLDITNSFQFLINDCYLDTTAGAGKNIIYRLNSCRFFVSDTNTGNITFEITGGATLSILAIPSDEYDIEVSANVTHLRIFLDGVQRGITPFTNNVTDSGTDWEILSGNTTIYAGSFILNK